MLLLTVAAAAAALIVVPKLTGSVPLTVLTGSMRPTYPEGDVLVVKPTAAEDLEIGDAITYQIRSGKPEVVTHRITSIVLGEGGKREFITRGDANDAADPDPVSEAQVQGRIWYSVPLVGYAAAAVDGAHRVVAVQVVAGGLLTYAGYLFATGLLDRRRRPVASQA